MPLFCFPGSDGGVQVFREMVAVLPEGQPVYGIDMGWLCEIAANFTVEEIAAFYLKIIRNVQKAGPYYFCGYSFGGLVAYEMARLLIDEGDEASLVAMFDAPNPAMMSNLSKKQSIQFHKTYLLDRLGNYAGDLLRGDIRSFNERGSKFIMSRIKRIIVPAIKLAFQNHEQAPAYTGPCERSWFPEGVACLRSEYLSERRGLFLSGKVADRKQNRIRRWDGVHARRVACKCMWSRVVTSA